MRLGHWPGSKGAQIEYLFVRSQAEADADAGTGCAYRRSPGPMGPFFPAAGIVGSRTVASRTPCGREAMLGRITGTTDLEEAGLSMDLVVEAITEDVAVKRGCSDDRAAAGTVHDRGYLHVVAATGRTGRRPRPAAQFIGYHWFNPPELIGLVEKVPGGRTATAVTDRLEALSLAIGKQPVRGGSGPAGIHRQPATVCADQGGLPPGRERRMHARRRGQGCHRRPRPALGCCRPVHVDGPGRPGRSPSGRIAVPSAVGGRRPSADADGTDRCRGGGGRRPGAACSAAMTSSRCDRAAGTPAACPGRHAPADGGAPDTAS